MDPNSCHRRPLTFLSLPNNLSPITLDGDLNEDDVIFSRDSSDHLPATADRRPFLWKSSPGILAALQEKIRPPILYRSLPAIPKREGEERELSQSAPVRKLVPSAPVRIPVAKVRFSERDLADVDMNKEGDEEMLPPHEIVVRSMRHSFTFSVLEGAGRTLKGRDLRCARDAVWRQTGFAD